MSPLKGKIAAGILAAMAFVLVSWLIIDGRHSVNADNDYMPLVLRTQVEQLKETVSNNPTTGTTLDVHLEILWRWINAFSFTGRVHDPQLTGFVASVRQDLALGIPADEVKYQGIKATTYLDGLVSILALLDKDPHTIGDININNSGPFVAGSYETIVVTYTIGNAAIEPGGGVLIGQHMMPDNMYFQTKDSAADNYVTIKTWRAGASFAREEIDFRGYYGRSSYLGMPRCFACAVKHCLRAM